MNTQLKVDFNEQGTDETFLWNQVREVLQHLPNEQQELMPGLKWGSAYQLYTPAFWKYQYLTNSFPANTETHRLAGSVRDEIVMCMLGGYGIPSEMGIIAFDRLKSECLIQPFIKLEILMEALSRPFDLEGGKKVRYRFARQKAEYIYAFLNRPDINDIPATNDLFTRVADVCKGHRL